MAPQCARRPSDPYPEKTGSYEQASYAIQDTADTVAKHYGRFLPKGKAALAAKILNKAWEDA